MFRKIIAILIAGSMIGLAEPIVSAAPRKGKAAAANNSTAAANKARHRRGMLHISVRTREGKAAHRALVRVIVRGRGRHQIVRRANGGGHVTLAVTGSSFVVRARGERGARGSSGGGVPAGGHMSVTVVLHGGLRRGGEVLGSSISGRGHGRMFLHRHERWGLGSIANHHAHQPQAKPGAKHESKTPGGNSATISPAAKH